MKWAQGTNPTTTVNVYLIVNVSINQSIPSNPTQDEKKVKTQDLWKHPIVEAILFLDCGLIWNTHNPLPYHPHFHSILQLLDYYYYCHWFLDTVFSIVHGWKKKKDDCEMKNFQLSLCFHESWYYSKMTPKRWIPTHNSSISSKFLCNEQGHILRNVINRERGVESQTTCEIEYVWAMKMIKTWTKIES